jgi:hypothetical protein
MLALLSRTLSIYRDYHDDAFCSFSVIQSNNPFTMTNRRSCYPVRSARSAGSSPVDKALKLVSPSRSQRHTVYGQAAFDAFSRFSSMIPSSPSSLFSTSASKGYNTILFYDKDQPYFNFTNFSPHSVDYNGKTYPTSEHLFQAFKVKYFKRLLWISKILIDIAQPVYAAPTRPCRTHPNLFR